MEFVHRGFTREKNNLNGHRHNYQENYWVLCIFSFTLWHQSCKQFRLKQQTGERCCFFPRNKQPLLSALLPSLASLFWAHFPARLLYTGLSQSFSFSSHLAAPPTLHPPAPCNAPHVFLPWLFKCFHHFPFVLVILLSFPRPSPSPLEVPQLYLSCILHPVL